MVKEWVMTQDDFDRFLAWLHPDRDEAGKIHEKIRCRLIKIFESRGMTEAEEMADDVIDRVIRKVPEVAETYVGDPALYFYGVASKVLLERTRRRPVPLPVPLPDPWDEKEPRYACLDDCMKKLPPEDQQVAQGYYADDGKTHKDRRQALAEELGVSLNALRIRLCRIRATLKGCISECLQQPAR